MTDPRNNTGSDYEDQLSRFEDRLQSDSDEESLLAEVGAAMQGLLLESTGAESRIRQILERQFDQGNLRKETYELVENLLGRLSAEQAAHVSTEVIADEPYTRTAVIEEADAGKSEAPATNPLQVGSVLRDRYLLKQSVSEGSMGVVYKALDRRLAETGEENVFVAIKVLSPKLSRNAAALRALQQEAAKGRCLTHPNIVRFIDLDKEGDVYFIVMEWLDGKSLSRILDTNPGDAIDLDMAMDIVRQIAGALEYAHKRGVIHADVKPGNVIISPDGTAKLIDFGVARIRQKENEGRSRFDPDIVRAATPAYSSMQVLTGEDPVAADDVFSLACLFYRLVAGYRVFGPRNAADAAEAGMEPQQPAGIGKDQWAALRKALSYSRVTRYQSPAEFLAAMDVVPASEAARAAPARKETRRAPPKKDLPLTAVRDDAPAAGTKDDVDIPISAGTESIMYVRERDAGGSPWRTIGVLVVLAGAGVLAWQMGYIAPLIERFQQADSVPPAAQAPATEAGIEDVAPPPEMDIAATDQDVVEELVVDAAGESVSVATTGSETAEEIAIPDNGGAADAADADIAGPSDIAEETAPPAPPIPPPIDFSVLPPPDVLLELDGSGAASATLQVEEGGPRAIIDLVRGGDLAEALEVRLAGPATADPGYRLENDGRLVFDPYQPRARTGLVAIQDDRRERDTTEQIRIVAAADPSTTLGTIMLTIEDDDRRAFEARLPVNLVAFSRDQVVVREGDSAVQVDVVRYHSDGRALELSYSLRDGTAREGQDFFAPGLPLIVFAPGQTNARVLIPLGQDARQEGTETFTIVLGGPRAPAGLDIFSEITVMIQDDDS